MLVGIFPELRTNRRKGWSSSSRRPSRKTGTPSVPAL
jgi:hypothetical protein